MPHNKVDPVDVTPSARRLTSSLRDIGYDFVAALADIIDNSVAASASICARSPSVMPGSAGLPAVTAATKARISAR